MWGIEMNFTLDEHIARRIRRRRRLLGLTLKELGERTGADFRRLHKYEIGATRPTPAFLYELSLALEVSISYFYEGHDSVSTAQDYGKIVDSSLCPQDRDFITSFLELDPSMRQSLAQLVKQYKAPLQDVA
jgi:transcriptional regulator with XRE-family HTH domain